MKLKATHSSLLKRALFSAVALVAALASIPCFAQNASEPTPLSGKIESIGVFKNGIAVVRERFDAPGVGRYATEAPRSAIHGSFFVQSYAVVDATSTNLETAVDLSEVESIDWTKDFKGCKLQVVLPNETEPRVVRIVASPTNQNVSNPIDPYSARMIPNPNASANGVLLECEDGKVVWVANPSSLQSVALLDGAPENFKRVKPSLVFDVQKTSNQAKGATIWVSYLTRGVTWAPQYRVDLLDDETLKIEQNAILINEWRDFDDATIRLYSGYPQIPLQNTNSPMNPSIGMQDFFASLNGAGGAGMYGSNRRSEGYMTQMAITSNSAMGGMARDVGFDANASESSIGDGVDIFAQEIGSKSLKKGDRILFTVGKAEVPYRKSVSWNIFDARDANGRPVDFNARGMNSEATNNHYAQTTSGEASLEYSNRFPEPWDVLSFNNPFDFPITTGPAVAYAGGRFLGQNSLFWTNPKEKTVLPITKALSVRVRSIENERIFDLQSEQNNLANPVSQPGEFLYPELKKDYWGKVINVRGTLYRVAVIDAEITLTNQRDEETRALVSRQFTGVLDPESLKNFDSDPKVIRLAIGPNYWAWPTNLQHELQMEITLKPGETKTLKFSYQAYIHM
ncbi:MAG: hypothetical protein J6X44_01510 [Thermoguttaceae bacterium]|nr:hypothetical protein [Thermoguttaceae bacterium]